MASSAARRGPRRRRPSPIRRVSIRTPRVAASAASAWPPPVVSLPSDRRTIRFCASSGKSARREAQRGADVGRRADRRRGEPVDLGRGRDGSRSTSASLPNATIPATSPSGVHGERLAQEGEGVLATGVADRVGQVDDEDRRQAVDRQDELEARPARGRAPTGGASGRRARRAAGPPPPAAAPPGGARSSRARAGMSSSSASGASKAMPIRRSRPARHARAGRRARGGCGSARRGGRRPTRRTGRAGREHDRDPQLVTGRRRGRRPHPRRAAGAGTRRGGRRDAERLDARPPSPGAIVDSSTSNRATAKRTGASGSTGGEAAADGSRPRRSGSPRRRRRARAARSGRAGRRCRRGAGSTMRRDGVDARQVGARERDGVDSRSCPGTSSTTEPSGRVTVSPVAPVGIDEARPASRAGPPRSARPSHPSSSPVRLASRIGKATWSGRSDRRGSKARTAVGRPAREARVEQRRAARPGDDGPRPVGQRRAAPPRRCGSSTGRRSAGPARRVERADARVRRACRSPRRAGSCAAGRWPGSGVRGRVAGRAPSKMTRSHGRPSCALAWPGRTRPAVTPNSSTFGR